MSYRTLGILWTASLLIGWFPAVARSQYYAGGAGAGSPPKDTVSVTGTATVKRPAAALRMHVELLGKGKTLEDALADLKDRRETATAQLQKLKANKDTIVFGSPSLSNLQSARKRQFEMMVAERMSSRGKKVPKGLKLPEVFNVSSTLTAEWPLEGKTPEQLLLAAHGLQTKIKAADLAGVKDAEKASPEEEELAEEMAEMTRNSGEEAPQPGVPQFLFVARMTEKDRQQALADAFAKAKTEAAALAKAAGVQLGPLVGLTGQGAANNTSLDDEMGGYPRAYLRHMRAQQFLENVGDQGKEALGTDPDSLTFVFYVQASFGLEK